MQALYNPTQFEVIWDTQTSADEDPVAVGTYRECVEIVKQNPDMRIIWIDSDLVYMPSFSIH